MGTNYCQLSIEERTMIQTQLEMGIKQVFHKVVGNCISLLFSFFGIPSGHSHFCSPFADVSHAHKSRFLTHRPVLFFWVTSIGRGNL